MNVTIDGIISRYNTEVATLTQRAILAEAQVEALEQRVAELESTTEENA